MMRTALAAVTILLVSTSVAAAQSDTSESFSASFEEITNSCTNVGLKLDKAVITVSQQKEAVRVAIPSIPSMTGRTRKGGSFKAEGEKRNGATKAVEQRVSAAGRASNGKIQLVFVAEFYRDGKPLCTQSWDVTGSRK